MNSTIIGIILGRTYLEQKDNERISIVWGFFALTVPAFYFYLIAVFPIFAIIGVAVGLLSLASIIIALHFYFKNEKMPAYAREKRMKMLQTLKILGITSLVALILSPVALMLYRTGESRNDYSGVEVALSVSLGIIAGTFAVCALIILNIKLISQAFSFLRLNADRDRNAEREEEALQDASTVEKPKERGAIGWLIAIGIVVLWLYYLMYQVVVLNMWDKDLARIFIIVGFLICFFLSLVVCITRVPMTNGEEVAKYKKTHKKFALGMLLFCLIPCVSIVFLLENREEYDPEIEMLFEEEYEEILPEEENEEILPVVPESLRNL